MRKIAQDKDLDRLPSCFIPPNSGRGRFSAAISTAHLLLRPLHGASTACRVAETSNRTGPTRGTSFAAFTFQRSPQASALGGPVSCEAHSNKKPRSDIAAASAPHTSAEHKRRQEAVISGNL